MQFTRLGMAGPAISRIGLGANSFGRYVEKGEARQIVHTAIDAGISLIDTASVYGGQYGSAETILGWALCGMPRERYFIATKVGFTFDRASRTSRPLQLTEASVREALVSSL